MKAGEESSSAIVERAKDLIRSHELLDAVDLLLKAIEARPPDERLFAVAVFALEEANRTEEALALAARASSLFPGASYFRVWEALMLPVLYDSAAEIEHYRARYATGLERLEAAFAIDADSSKCAPLEAFTHRVNFYLGYQGRNDRQLQERYAAMSSRAASTRYPDWSRPLDMPEIAPGVRVRVGYISAHFRNHSVGKLFSGWIEEHDRERFEIFAYHNGGTVDDLTGRIRSSVDRFYHLPGDLHALCEAIASDNLHVAVYLDVRHRRMSVAASLRLAPIQCLAWAHPLTSGLSTLDYFLSSDTMEPPDGAAHYTEKLVRLPGIGVFYPKPLIPRPLLKKQRADFGLRDDSIVYLCCQSSFKYLPQHDHLFPEIARRVRSAQFAFIALNDAIGKELNARLEKAFVSAGLKPADHLVMLPALSWLDYLNLNLLSDVFLDTLDWSGGVTALEAIACELPIVTLPGEFMRGRHSYGILRHIGVEDTIASDKKDYVEIAVRLGLDTRWHDDIVRRMCERENVLFRDRRPVRALESFYLSAVEDALKARSPGSSINPLKVD